MKITLSKKNLIISAVVLLVVIAAVISIIFFAGNKDFRNTYWGMSYSRVKSAESGEPLKEFDDRLIYKINNIEGIEVDAILNYNFDYNPEKSRYDLWQANTGIEVSGFNDKLAVKLLDAFEEKYGEPDEYFETTTKHDHFWKLEKTEIHVEQLERYILIEYTDISYAID